jgi:hypothetical protein
VPGGANNLASGAYSFAAGHLAKATGTGSFVWADDSSSVPFGDYGGFGLDVISNEFLVRASGGIVLTPYDRGLGNEAEGTPGLGDPGLFIGYSDFADSDHSSLTSPLGDSSITLDDSEYSGYDYIELDSFAITLNGKVGIGLTPTGTNILQIAGGAYCSGTTWVNASDKNLKDNFKHVDPSVILAKVSAMPISTWHYKSEAGQLRHIGPTAQDFYTAFNFGYDDKSITTVDEGGVALAAIQGLDEKVEGRSKNEEGKIQKLETENEVLKQQNDLLAQRLNELEETVKTLANRN